MFVDVKLIILTRTNKMHLVVFHNVCPLIRLITTPTSANSSNTSVMSRQS